MRVGTGRSCLQTGPTKSGGWNCSNIFCQRIAPFTETNGPSRTPQNQPHTIILLALNFTLVIVAVPSPWKPNANRLVHWFTARYVWFISLQTPVCIQRFRLHLVMWGVLRPLGQWNMTLLTPAFELKWICPNAFDNKLPYFFYETGRVFKKNKLKSSPWSH